MTAVRIMLVAATVSLAACSGGAKSTAGDDGAKAKGGGDLALCTGGAVPVGATNCLLDLGTGQDSYWSDTDGVDPGTAGCHYEFTDDTCGVVKPGRAFGEFCLDGDRLVESNPGADECHTHGGDMGKPGVVSCSAWCAEQSGAGGRCEGGVTAEGAAGACESARCVCG